MEKAEIPESELARMAEEMERLVEKAYRESKLRQIRTPEIDVQETLAMLVKSMRKKNMMTQQQFAESAGISQTYISLIESGRRPVNLQILQNIAYALGYKLWELIKLAEQK